MTEGQLRLLERNKEIAALYLKGETLERAGAPFGLKKERVRQILLRQNVAPRRGWSKAEPKPTAEEKRKIKEINFWSQANLTADANRCWEWRGNVLSGGHGRISRHGKTVYARRVDWELYNRRAPVNYILDTCANSGCVNPNHLIESSGKKKKKKKEKKPINSL